MMVSIAAAFVWIVVGTIISLLPRHNHWPGAIFLMIAFVPVFVLIGTQAGWLYAVLFLAGAASYLRYPVFYTLKFLYCKALGKPFSWPSFGRRGYDDG